MKITDSKKLEDIQEEFNRMFPYLNLEFYQAEHKAGEPSHVREQLNAEKTIGEVRTVHLEGDLNIDGQQKVSALEAAFRERYGLNVQVFRRSANLWLQTSATDQWTLAEQNTKGEHSLKAFNEMRSE